MKQKTLIKHLFLLIALVIGGVGNAWADTVTMWEEDFSTYSANDIPSGGTYSYVCTDGGSITKIYKDNLAGGTAPELLVSKSNGTFSATIPLNNIEGDLTLTFYTNNQSISVSTTTTGISGSLSEKAAGKHTLTFTGVTTSMNQIVIVFTGSGSSNVRLDDIKLVYTSGPAEPTISANNVNIDYDTTAGTIESTINNPVAGGILTAAKKTEAAWLTLRSVSGTNVPFTATVNEGGTNRVATVTLTYTYNTTETATKDVLITQGHPVVDYATLPYEWAGGSSTNLLAEDGVTASGLGSDYAASNTPYMVKFDTTGDYIQIKTDSQPGVVTIGVKMIGGASTSYITIQESSNGEDFTNVEQLTISGSQNSTHELKTTQSFKTATKYVRLLFTKGSNVGVGPISIAKPVAKTDPTITFNNGNVRVGKTLDLSTLFTSNSTGDVTYSITAGDSYASIDGSIITGTAAGSVTVKAEQEATTTYNAGEATATITVEAAPTLSSIAITTAPTKTVYTEGDTFDATGMVVTATYSDASSDDVTASCTWSPAGALTTSDTEVTISYTENAVTKTATQVITVNEYTQPEEVEITNWSALFGVAADAGALSRANLKDYEGTMDGVSLVYKKASSMYIKSDDIRIYNGSALSFTAPTGYVMTEVTFAGTSSSDKAPTADVGTFNYSTKKWTGVAEEFTLSRNSGNGYTKFTSATITLAPGTKVTNAKYATYVTVKHTDFASSTGVTAYKVTNADDKITLVEIDEAPKGTPVVIAAEEDTYALEVAASEPAAVTGNILRVSDGSIVGDYETDGVGYISTYYVLGKNGSWVGFAPLANGVTLPKGKAYIHDNDWTDSAAKAFLPFVIDDETTGINSIENGKLNIEGAYNLNGQKVSGNYKGIVIINGKKYLNK